MFRSLCCFVSTCTCYCITIWGSSLCASGDQHGTPSLPQIGRGTFPLFIDSNPAFPLAMPEGCTREQVLGNTMDSKVPPLRERWLENGVTFGDFLGDTFKQYYEWAMTKKAHESA